jgi:lysophospholipase L1-like esterase
MPVGRVRNVLALAAFLLPACVVRLSDRNQAAPAGDVTGPAADCAQVAPPPRGVPGGDPAVRLVGRFDRSDPAAPRFDWSVNWIEARFDGTRVAISLEVPDDNRDVLFTVAIDDRPPSRITVSGKREGGKRQIAYELASDLAPGPHEVRVHRDTEAPAGGVVLFRGIDVAPGKLLPPTQRQRRIEVVGDSITCGYGDMGANATCPYDIAVRPFVDDTGAPVPNLDVRVPLTQSQYLAYSAIAGRELDADVTTLCWSGKGVSLNYREESEPDANGKRTPLLDAKSTMVDLYGRTVAYRQEVPEGTPQPSDWDFTKEPEPQVVLVNLGTNDFTRDQDAPFGVSEPLDLAKFRAAYLAFVERIRAVRPNAHIFMMTPPMVSDTFPADNARRDLRDALRHVVDARAATGDAKVYAMDLVEQGTRYGLGCDYHPNLDVHRLMAEQVTAAIRSKTCW